MDASYRREGNRSYLILTAESESDADYRIPMLLQNRIPGVLPVHMQVTDGVRELYYEITSYEALTRSYEAEKMTREEILHLLFALSRIMDEADRYLLQGSGIVLEPEYVFMGLDGKEISFCYDPGDCGSTTEGLNRMARFILDHIDYDDKECVRIAYALFQESMRENVTVRDFLKTAVDLNPERPGEDGYTGEEDRYTGEEGRYAGEEDRYAGEKGRYAGEEDRYAEEETEEGEIKKKKTKKKGIKEREIKEREASGYAMRKPGNRERPKEEEGGVRRALLQMKKKGVPLCLEILSLGCVNALILICLTWGIWNASELLIPEQYLFGLGIAGAFAASGVTGGIRCLIRKN